MDGCPITFPKPRKPREVTYAEHVAPILAEALLGVPPGRRLGPVRADELQAGRGAGGGVAEVIADQRMPPWFASHEFGPFVNRRGLTDEERATITDWVDPAPRPATSPRRRRRPSRRRTSG